MPRIWICIIIIALLATGCSESSSTFTVKENDGILHAVNRQGWNMWDDTASAPIDFKREQTFGTDKEGGPSLLGGVGALAVDSAGTVYVLDDENLRLLAFNPDGKVRWSAGRKGEGPGEFWRPEDLVLGNKGHLFVANKRGRQIDMWTTEGTFVERHSFEEKDLGLLDLVGFADGFLVVSESGFGSNPQTLHSLDTETWTLAHSFLLKREMKLPENLSVSVSVGTVGDSIFVSGLTEYTLSRYSVNGSLGFRISRGVGVLRKPGVYNRGMKIYSEMDAPVRLSEGHLLVDVWWPNNVSDPDAHFRRLRTGSAEEVVPVSTIDLFTPIGRYIGSLRWKNRYHPSIGDLKTVDSNGKLYTTTNEPFPQIRRYEVTLQDVAFQNE